jgi:putative membrane protein
MAAPDQPTSASAGSAAAKPVRDPGSNLTGNLVSIGRSSAIALVMVGVLMAIDSKQAYGWWKSFHIIMVTSWFAGLFYLPRIFVNLAMVPEGQDHRAEMDRLLLMSNKLYKFMTPIGVLALASGLWVWLGYGVSGGWMHAKMLVVVLLVIYHGLCHVRVEAFNHHRNARSHIWYRWFNEIPVLLLTIAVSLVVVKPF